MEEDLKKSSKEILKTTNEGAYSLPLKEKDLYTVYYVYKKTLYNQIFIKEQNLKFTDNFF